MIARRTTRARPSSSAPLEFDSRITDIMSRVKHESADIRKIRQELVPRDNARHRHRSINLSVDKMNEEFDSRLRERFKSIKKDSRPATSNTFYRPRRTQRRSSVIGNSMLSSLFSSKLPKHTERQLRLF
jgi:hypothetical protein